MIAGDGQSTRFVYHALDRAIGVDRVIVEGPVARKTFFERRIKKLGLRTVAGQVLFKAVVDVPLELASRARVREIQSEFALDDGPIPERARTDVVSINAPEAIAALRALDPAVIVVNGTRIIAKGVLEAVRAPFLNMHAGITPLYRGVHGGYWALAMGDRDHCGVTVHLVDPGIDTGGIVGQALIHPTPADNFTTYPVLQIAAGLPLMIDAVKAALAGTLRQRSAPPGKSRLWSHPTLGQYLRARIENGTR
jgi:folate-dependent phosphoribosylglycinamide formyltransferase PurN